MFSLKFAAKELKKSGPERLIKLREALIKVVLPIRHRDPKEKRAITIIICH